MTRITTIQDYFLYDYEIAKLLRRVLNDIFKCDDEFEILLNNWQLHSTFHIVFMHTVRYLRALYPDKQIRLVLCGEPPDSPKQGIIWNNALSDTLNRVLDGIAEIRPNEGEVDNFYDKPRYNVMECFDEVRPLANANKEVHYAEQISLPLIEEADIIISYIYPILLSQKEKKRFNLCVNSKKMFDVTCEDTTRAIFAFIETQREDRRNAILCEIDSKYSVLARKLGVSGTTIRWRANRARYLTMMHFDLLQTP